MRWRPVGGVHSKPASFWEFQSQRRTQPSYRAKLETGGAATGNAQNYSADSYRSALKGVNSGRYVQHPQSPYRSASAVDDNYDDGYDSDEYYCEAEDCLSEELEIS